jgi:3-mercaptopyruvate sulfurtransferase SseA
MAGVLRSRQITPELLNMRLDAGEQFAIIDLLRFEDDSEGVVAIPGAVRLDPLELRRKRSVVMPAGLDLIRYSRSENSFVNTRVAAGLRRHGIDDIYVVDGGLAAWELMGFPVSLDCRKGHFVQRSPGRYLPAEFPDEHSVSSALEANARD